MKQKPRVSTSAVIVDAPPEVLRAHAIADTLRSLARHCHIDWQNDHRAAVAVELGVPELWLDAAVGDIRDMPTVSLELLQEFADWKARLMPNEKGAR